MRNGIVHVWRNITTCLVGITLIGCAGCGAAVDQQDTKQPTGSADSDPSKAKIAIRYRITSTFFLIWTPNPIPSIP